MMFLAIFRRFPKILKMLPEGRTNISEHFPNFSEDIRRLPKIAKDCRGRSEDAPTQYRLSLAHSALKQVSQC